MDKSDITRISIMVYTGPLKDKKHATVEFVKKDTVDKLVDGTFRFGVLCKDIAMADERLRECIRLNNTPLPTEFKNGLTTIHPDIFAVSPEDWMNLPKKQNAAPQELSVSKKESTKGLFMNSDEGRALLDVLKNYSCFNTGNRLDSVIDRLKELFP